MHVDRKGTVVIPTKGKNLQEVSNMVDTIMLAALKNSAIMKVEERPNIWFIHFEHGQVKTPKDISTKMKIGNKALLEAYKMWDKI